MRHLRGGEYVTPNVSLIADNNSVMFNPVPPIEPITFYVKDTATNIIYEFTLPVEYKNFNEYCFDDDGPTGNQLMSNNYSGVYIFYNTGLSVNVNGYYYCLYGYSNLIEHPIKNYTYTINTNSAGDPM